MKRILNFRLTLALAIAWPVLVVAQRVDHNATTRVNVLAPSSYVVAARSLQLTAQPTNLFGAVLRGKTIAWQLSDPTRASIDNTGLLVGIAPGPVTVTATDTASGISGLLPVLVYPGGVTVSSASTTVQVGDKLPLTAQAQDADGNPIAGVPFQWFTDVAAVAGVSQDGVLTGIAEGRVTVTAAIDMGPDFERFTAFRTIEVVRRAAFHLKTLISSDTTAASATALVPTHISAAGAYVGAITSTSNGGQALLLEHANAVQTISMSGSLLNGRIITRFEGVSVNSQGDVLTLADAQNEWCEQLLVLFPAASKWSPTIIDDTTRCSYSMQPGSLDKSGAVVYRYANTLYYRKPDGATLTLLNIGDQPAGKDTVANINSYAASRFGKVLIQTQNTAGNNVFYVWDGTQLTRQFAVGDTILSNVSQWAELPQEISAGEYITRIGGGNWSSISRLKNGVWSTVTINSQNGLGWVQDGYDGADGYIFYFQDNNKGQTSLFRSNGASTDTLGTYANWREVSQLTATGGDSVIAYGTLGGKVLQVLSFTGSSSTAVLASGTAITGKPAPALAQASIPKGINPSSAILKTWGDTLFKVTPSGITTLLQPGGTLPGGSLSSLGNVAANRLGDIAFTAEHGNKFGLYTYRNGQFQLLADTDDTITGGQIGSFATYTDNLIAMNNQGHVAAFAYTNLIYGVYLFTGPGPASQNVARTNSPSASSNLTGVSNLAIDDTDRIAFIGNLSNGRQGVFLWSQGNLTELLETGQTDSFGRAYQYLNSLVAAGTKFYVRASTNVNEILALDGTTINILAHDGSVTSFGTTISNLIGPEVTANSRGDVAFPALTPSGAALFVHHADGTDAQVAIGSQRGPDSEWFLDIYGSGIGEQGDIVFSALGWAGDHPRLALYQATPASN